MSVNFDNRKALEAFMERLVEYRDDSGLDEYPNECFIEDVLYFIGMAIDDKHYRNANGYRRFIVKYVYQPAKKINEWNKDVFKRRLNQ